jgi:hypothetical protein
VAVAVLVLTMGSSPAMADRRASAVPVSPTYRQECASCHLAYPPGLLPAASWQRLMSDLPHHFGVDASLEPSAAQEVSTWLSAHAARTRERPAADRITRTAWFAHEHHEVPDSAWQRSAIKSPANCAACHAQADQGDFDEHRVRIPR